MSPLWWVVVTVGGFLGTALLGALGALVSEEIRGRLERIPHWLIRLAARRLPPELRDDRAEEWLTELPEFLHGADGLPLTRLYQGIRYALGLLRTAPGIGRDLAEVTPPPQQGRMVDFSGTAVAASAAVAHLDVRPGPVACPRCGQPALQVGDDRGPHCTSCGQTWADGQAAAEEYASVLLGLDWHSVKDGGPPPTMDCPECGSPDTVVWDEHPGQSNRLTARCLECGERFNEECGRCGVPMWSRPDDGVACSDCWAGIMSSVN